jgi:hypothetical protein
MPKVMLMKNTVRVMKGDLWKYYEEHPEIFEAIRLHEVGDIGWTKRLACLVKENSYGVPSGWQTMGFVGWYPHQVEWDAEKKVLTVHDRKAMEILRKSGILSELEAEGITVVEDIHPREELIKIYGALPKEWIPIYKEGE